MSNMNKDKRDAWFNRGCPLPMEAELIKPEVRLAVMRNKSHKGALRTLLMNAYNEIRKQMGKQTRQIDCTSCNGALNRQLQIWYRFYDNRTPGQKKMCQISSTGELLNLSNEDAVKGTQEGMLIPIDDRKAQLEKEDYRKLLKILKTEKPARYQQLVEENNGNHMIKKPVIIHELLQ